MPRSEKRRRLLLLLLVALPVAFALGLAGCSGETDRSELIQKEGRLFTKDSPQPFTGKAVLEQECVHKTVTEYENGLKHGTEEKYVYSEDCDAILTQRAQYDRGKLHGIFEVFHANGQLQRRSEHQAGEYHGRLQEWSPSGVLLREMNYENGRKTLHRSYNSAGTLQKEITYDNAGRALQEIIQSESGKIRCDYLYGHEVMTKNCFDAAGEKISEHIWKNGKLMQRKFLKPSAVPRD